MTLSHLNMLLKFGVGLGGVVTTFLTLYVCYSQGFLFGNSSQFISVGILGVLLTIFLVWVLSQNSSSSRHPKLGVPFFVLALLAIVNIHLVVGSSGGITQSPMSFSYIYTLSIIQVIQQADKNFSKRSIFYPALFFLVLSFIINLYFSEYWFSGETISTFFGDCIPWTFEYSEAAASSDNGHLKFLFAVVYLLQGTILIRGNLNR